MYLNISHCSMIFMRKLWHRHKPNRKDRPPKNSQLAKSVPPAWNRNLRKRHACSVGFPSLMFSTVPGILRRVSWIRELGSFDDTHRGRSVSLRSPEERNPAPVQFDSPPTPPSLLHLSRPSPPSIQLCLGDLLLLAPAMGAFRGLVSCLSDANAASVSSSRSGYPLASTLRAVF
jgi:hypothetical protein